MMRYSNRLRPEGGIPVKIQDISVRKRLLISNFVMVCVPVLLFLLLGGIVLGGLRLTGNVKQKEMEMLWPEGGAAISVHMAFTTLRDQADRRDGPKTEKIAEACQALEAEGLQVTVVKGRQVLYVTPGALSEEIQTLQSVRYAQAGTGFLWDDKGLSFRYESQRTGVVVAAVGNHPLFVPDRRPPAQVRDILETTAVVFVGLAVLIIIVTGMFLSRWLSSQIVKPLENLRQGAQEISRGNLDYTLVSEARDELGDTCREFNHMREELKTARQAREKYEINRKELIAGISHDLSTPLTSVKGYASGLIDGIARTPEKQRHYFQMIYQTATSMERLVGSLFLFSKLDLGREPFHWEPVSLRDYLTDYVAENKAPLALRGMHISLEAAPEACCVSLDRLQFQRVVENLIENSIKYKKGDTGHLTILLQCRLKGMVYLEFSDDGIGVAPEELPKLFDSFYRTDPARANVAKGSGLGLAIVKQIIQAMAGKIWAQRSTSEGLAVCIMLPLCEEEKR